MRITLTKSQWERVSEISGNLGVASIFSLVVPYLFRALDLRIVILGLVITSVLWYFSVRVAKKY